MAGNDSWFRKRFRSAEAPKKSDATDALSQLRASRSPAEYATLFGAFRTAAPKTFRALTFSGPRSASELIWARKAFQPLSLENELRWAVHWLSPHAARVNAFRYLAIEIQTQLIDGDVDAAKTLLDDYVRSAGWSLWAVELRAALVQLSQGNLSQREWLGQLQARTVNSVPGLLFEIFGDRNDDTYSYDAIYGKCMSSFPRFDSLAPWLVDYLKFRALAHIDDPAKALPNILGRDIASSLVDYYEDVLETLTCIESNDVLIALRPQASTLLSSLIGNGYKDHRLTKLLLALDSGPLPPLDISSRPEERYRALYLGSFKPDSATLPAGIAADLQHCENEGAAAYELVGKLLKWGLNLRGIDIGPAVALAALRATSSTPDERSLPLSTFLLSGSLCIDDAAGVSSDKALELLRSYVSSRGGPSGTEHLLKPSLWSVVEILPHGGPIYLWLGTKLLEAREFAELETLSGLLQGKSPYWDRQCAKWAVLANVKRGSLAAAIAVLEAWHRKNHLYAIEFPADILFSERKWADFKEHDPVTVGIVAHHEYTTRGAANVAYICKMACRAFLQSGLRERIADEFYALSDIRKAQIIAFLRDVWVEENLSMCHQFESTAQVRVERMIVLQHLLVWESERAAEYAEAIKDLTFDQTLQRGLQRIDQTRVFVNESAITRWAEKELEQDYERWRKLTESTSGGRAVDDMLRQYLLDPTNAEILKEFSSGKPTAADALFISMIDRLYKRFLLDPADGLDTYLSVRIRHGSLRGTILGPLEEQGLLYSTSGFSEKAFESRWDDVLRLPLADKASLVGMMQEFSVDIRRTVDDFVEQRVQVQRADKPEGAFHQDLPPAFARVIAASLAERPPSFHAFLCSGYFVFWSLVKAGLLHLRTHVEEVLASALHSRLERLIQDLRAFGPGCLPLVTTLTTASTMTKSQCATVGEWFQLPSLIEGEKYELADAIEIASVATKNVHRAFSADVQVLSLPASHLPLTTSALAVLMDCLFVVFENSWKHSGLGSELPPIELNAEYDTISRLLTLVCHSGISVRRKRELQDGELTRLRTKYLGELPLELISLEGGSGLPKLARLTRSTSTEACPQPFDFGIEGDQWYTRLTVPLYQRDGAFEAYE